MLAERAELVAELRLDDKMSAGLSRASRGLSNFSKNVGLSKRNLAALQTNLVRIGAVAAVGIGAAVKGGIDSLVALESANAQTAAAIKSTGAAANITAAQVRELSEALEDKTTIDDKQIQAAANLMLTFTGVRNEAGKGNDIFNQSVGIMADMATALGTDMSASAIQLGKALNDPTKGLTALTRVGVTFDAKQVKRIKAFQKEGKVIEAQKIILAELNKEFGGSAAAQADTYAGKMRRLRDAVEGLQMSLAEALMPVLSEVSAELNTFLRDPAVVSGIKDFGKTLADGFRSAVAIAKQLPWAQIGQSLQLAGAGAKAVLGAFTSLPPWVQTAVLTGWGLNKLTGGALTGIVGGLGKGLAQALGGSLFQRGGTPANPLFVADVTGGGGGGPLGKAGKLGGLSATAIAGVAASAAALVGSLVVVQKGIIEPKLQAQAGRNITGTEAIIARGDAQELSRAITGLREMPSKLSPLQKVLYDLNANGVKTHTEGLIAEMQKALSQTSAATSDPTGFKASLGPALGPIMERATAKGLTPTYQQLQKTAAANDARARENATKLAELSRVTGAGDERIASRFTSLNAAVNRTTAVIASKNFSPRINVPVYVTNNVSVRQTQTAVAVNSRYNPRPM